ncbi:MAG: hypothetical protein ACM3ME_02170 [Chloroflexota bacterium]
MKNFNTLCCAVIVALFSIMMLSFNSQVTAQVNIPGVAPVAIPLGGFAVDGDALANFPASSPYDNAGDWFSDNSYSGTGGTIFDMTTSEPFDFIDALVHPFIMAIHYNDPYEGIDPTTFTSSNKINDDPSTYTWGPNSAGSPPKNEINNATVSFSWGNPSLGGNANELWAIVAGDRQTITGSSYIDFEFLQNSLFMTGTTSGGFTTEGPDGGRTEGDVLVTLEFINGGNIAQVVINKWTLVNGSYKYVEQDNNNFVGAIFCTANTSVTIAPWLPFGQTQYEINQYAEAAVNLSTLFNFTAESCGVISTVFVRTRSSGNSAQSELKDLPGAPFQVNLDLDDLAVVCPDDVTLTACTSLADITTAYNNWVTGFTYNGGNGTVVTNIDDLSTTLPSDVTCGFEITFNYEITDNCNIVPLTCSSTFTVTPDLENPVLIAPDDISYQCISDVPAAGMLGWTDNCDGSGEVQGTDESDGNTCPEIITRTWSYTDNCGNTTTVSQTITVDDDTAPVFDPAPADISYQCIGDVPEVGMLGWTDNCDGSGEVLGTDESDGNTCPEIITRTWSYTDACGNPASVSQIITVDDDTAPVLESELTDLEFACAEDVVIPDPIFSDNCSEIVEVVCSITGHPDVECGEYEFPVGDTQICFQAFDDCGNSCAPSCITITVLPCGDDFCTLTQGYYGNAGGMYCTGETTTQLLNRLLSSSLVVGMNNRTFTIPAGASQCVINILPGGGQSAVLPVGSWGCGNFGNLLDNKGELKNSLLAQTITLGLNLRLDMDMANFAFTSATFYTLASSSCDGEDPQPVPNTEIYYTGTNAMPASVMNKFGGDPTVMEIYTLANQALANINTGVPLGDVTKAVGTINNAFDKCRFIIFLPPLQSIVVEPGEQNSQVTLQISPNPFNHETNISFELQSDSRVTLDVYNTQGVKVSSIFAGDAKAGNTYSYRYSVPAVSNQLLIVVLRTNYGTFSKRIVSMK